MKKLLFLFLLLGEHSTYGFVTLIDVNTKNSIEVCLEKFRLSTHKNLFYTYSHTLNTFLSISRDYIKNGVSEIPESFISKTHQINIRNLIYKLIYLEVYVSSDWTLNSLTTILHATTASKFKGYMPEPITSMKAKTKIDYQSVRNACNNIITISAYLQIFIQSALPDKNYVTTMNKRLEKLKTCALDVLKKLSSQNKNEESDSDDGTIKPLSTKTEPIHRETSISSSSQNPGTSKKLSPLLSSAKNSLHSKTTTFSAKKHFK